MRLIDLIAAIGGDPESDIKIQIWYPGRDWGIMTHSTPVRSF